VILIADNRRVCPEFSAKYDDNNEKSQNLYRKSAISRQRMEIYKRKWMRWNALEKPVQIAGRSKGFCAVEGEYHDYTENDKFSTKNRQYLHN
jgi:hypothetical protein